MLHHQIFVRSLNRLQYSFHKMLPVDSQKSPVKCWILRGKSIDPFSNSAAIPASVITACLESPASVAESFKNSSCHFGGRMGKKRESV